MCLGETSRSRNESETRVVGPYQNITMSSNGQSAKLNANLIPASPLQAMPQSITTNTLQIQLGEG